MGSEGQTLHVLFFPFMAPGHILPMLDIAKHFAARGARSTVLTTPANAAKLQPTIDRANNRKNHPGHHHPITLHVVPFPAAAVGLPPGCEAVSSIPSGDLLPNFFAALRMLRQPFDRALRDLLPDCVVADMFFPWTTDAAAEHGVPRLVFHGQNAFSLCCAEAVYRSRAAIPDSDSEPFAIPGLPHCITIHKSQIPDFRQPPFIKTLFDERREAEPRSFGVVFNSFYELEPDYADYFMNVLGRKAWHIGPVALRSEHTEDEPADGAAHLHWLDGKRPGSVVYVCFGSISHTSAAEIRELALGLEASGRPFVWAIRKGGGAEWIPEGFEERVEGRGLIITEWAPQILILNHTAVGGFLTHCGWNSCLEGISAGLPLITWPLFADQFYNERLIVDVLKVGVAVGASVCSTMPEERAVVGADKVTEAVEKVMGGGEGAEEMRRRARELGEKARRAVERGGSSYADLGRLIEELMERKIALVDKPRQPIDPDGAIVKQPLALRSAGDIVCN